MSTPTAGQPGRNFLVTFIGLFTLLWGLLHVAFGLYVMVAGADAAMQLLQAGAEAQKEAGAVGGEGKTLGEAAGIGAKGLAALAGVFGVCVMLWGLPEILAGIGVMLRRQWGRILTFILAALALLSGLGSLANFSEGGVWVVIGLIQILFAIAAYYALIKYGYEFARQAV